MWGNLPVIMELLEGQQTGVVVKWLLAETPSEMRRFCVAGIRSTLPRSRSWSSVKTKMMLGTAPCGGPGGGPGGGAAHAFLAIPAEQEFGN